MAEYRKIRDEVAQALDTFHAQVMRGSGVSVDAIGKELYPGDFLGPRKVRRLLRKRPDISIAAFTSFSMMLGFRARFAMEPIATPDAIGDDPTLFAGDPRVAAAPRPRRRRKR